MKPINCLNQCSVLYSSISSTLQRTSSVAGARHIHSTLSSLCFVSSPLIGQKRDIHPNLVHPFISSCYKSTTQKRRMSKLAYTGPFGSDFIFRQLLEYKSYTYTYLLADPETNDAVIIDPVLETVDRDVKIVHDLGLNLLYAANTHVHADHVTGSGSIKKLIPTCKSVIAEVSKAKADVKIKEGDLIKFGKYQLEARSTPGHTDGCMTFVLHEKGLVFTGDALLIRGCGRTDFQQGNPGSLYDSIHKKILNLPQQYFVLPAHDYTGQTMSTVGEELRYNPRLTKPKNEFIEIMKNLHLPYPKQIDKALPANMVCGVFDVPESS